MTKKELAYNIYDMNMALGVFGPQNNLTKEEWTRRILEGCGQLEPCNYDSLLNWYNNLRNRLYNYNYR